MQFRNDDDDEDIVDMNYLLAAANIDDHDSSPPKQNSMSAKGPQLNSFKRSQSSKEMPNNHHQNQQPDVYEGTNQIFADEFANKLNMGNSASKYTSDKKRKPLAKRQSMNQYTIDNDPNLHLDDDEMIKF